MQNPGEHQSRNQIENKISDTNKGHQSCRKYQQDTEIRAITRSEQNEHIKKNSIYTVRVGTNRNTTIAILR